MEASESENLATPERVGDRYRVLRSLGRGGMAAVYEGIDEATGKHVAIKCVHAHRMFADDHVARLFEQEFHTLTQLAHPRVVEVYDYQRLDDGAFYTMELLDGGDLVAQHKMPWKEVCALLCDVCSALSLLHSRRLVHRDVTPTNIRRTRDGKAKLIDFGAMVPFGTHKRTVGTPTFTPPEAVTGQALDGRADLYALGATAYYALTGRHAYPARTFANLRNTWRSQPALPSRLTPDIPPALDQLVMSLLDLAPARRPSSAAAVIERLTAIAGLELQELPQVQRSFLSTPGLVGRDPVLQRLRKQMISAARGRGFALLMHGPRGVGRSRLVDACALEGKLASAILLRADAADAQDGEWGGVRSLLDQLVAELPGRAQELLRPCAAALSPVWPRVLELTGTQPSLPPQTQNLWPSVQTAMLGLMLAVSRQSLVVVTADDIERLDDPSRAFIALLAQQVDGRRLAVVTTACDDATGDGERALQLLRKPDASIALPALSSEDSESLLISVFGEAPNVRRLANHLHEASGGLPGAIMELTQHLLDRNLVSFQDGAWMLPSQLDAGSLPTGAADAMRQRLAGIDIDSLTLARAIALSAKPAVAIEECELLAGDASFGAVLVRLDALVLAQVLVLTGKRYAFARPGWEQLLLADLDPTLARTLHGRIAELFAKQRGAELRAAGHLIASDQASAAIDLLLGYVVHQGSQLNQEPALLADVVRALPTNWIATLEEAVAASDRLERPMHDRMTLRSLLLQLLSLRAEPRVALALSVINRLYVDCGLSDYAALEDAPKSSRLQQALARAQQRFDETPAVERWLPPIEAISELARALTRAIGMMGASADAAFLRALPSLAPFAPISPLLRAVQLNLQSTCHIVAGQLAQARKTQLELLEMMAVPGGIGFVPAIHHYVELSITYAAALTETVCGIARASDRTDLLERDPMFEVNAWILRMVRALRQGDIETAERCERQAELLQIRNAPPQFFEGAMVFHETVAHAEVGDVARIRNTLERLDASAAKFPNRRVAPLFGRGHVFLLRGEAEAALGAFSEALSLCAAGEVWSWAPTVRGYLTALAACRRVADARARGAVFLEQAVAAGLTVQIAEIHLAMVLVELAGGDHAQALAQLAAVEAIRDSWPLGEVFGGACFELRARIALEMRDGTAFATAAMHCGKHFLPSRNPILIGRHQRLMQDAERAGMLGAKLEDRASLLESSADIALTTAATTRATEGLSFADCLGFDDRVARALALMTEHDSTRHAMLYLMREGTLSMVGKLGYCPDPSRIAPLAAAFLRGELDGSQGELVDPNDFVTSTIDEGEWAGPNGVQFAPALLSHPVHEGLAITGVLIFDVEGRRPQDAILTELSTALAVTGDCEPTIIGRSPSLGNGPA